MPRSISRFSLLALCLSGIYVAACGGGGGGGTPSGDDGTAPTAPPAPTGELIVDFPPQQSFAELVFTETLTIRGRFEGDALPDAVTVNGDPAELDSTGAWMAKVTMPSEEAVLDVTIDATDAEGNTLDRKNVQLDAISVLPYLLNAFTFTSDPAGPIYAVDRGHETVLRFSRTDGRFLPSGQFFGTLFSDALGWSDGLERLLVVAGAGLFAVDPTGDRELISSSAPTPPVGEGPPISLPSGLVVDSVASVAYLALPQRNAVTAVNLTTGDREDVARHGDGGPVLTTPLSLALDASAGALYVADPFSLQRVDLASRQRERIKVNLGSETRFDEIAFDSVTGDLLVAAKHDGDSGASIYRLEPATGIHSLLSGPTRGDGPLLTEVQELAADPQNGGVLAAARGLETLVAIDPVNGDRHGLPLHFGGAESGERWRNPVDIGIHRDKLLLADATVGRVLELPLDGGAATELSGPTAGGGPAFGSIKRMKRAASHAILHVLTTDNRVLAVDLSTGQRKELVDVDKLPVPFNTVAPVSFVVHPLCNRLFVLGYMSGEMHLLAIDSDDGAVEQLTDAVASETLLKQTPGPSDLLFDAKRERLIISGSNSAARLSTLSLTTRKVAALGPAAPLPGYRLQLSEDEDSVFIRANPHVLRLDLLTEAVSEVTRDYREGEGPLSTYELRGGFFYDDARGVIWFALSENGAIVAYDVVSGDRVYFAR